MANRITCLVVDVTDAELVAGFWTEVLGWQITEREHDPEGIRIQESPDARFAIDFFVVPDGPKTTKNRLHLDLNATDRDQAAELERLLALGARPVDVGQGTTSRGTCWPTPRATSSACSAREWTRDDSPAPGSVSGGDLDADPDHQGGRHQQEDHPDEGHPSGDAPCGHRGTHRPRWWPPSAGRPATAVRPGARRRRERPGWWRRWRSWPWRWPARSPARSARPGRRPGRCRCRARRRRRTSRSPAH